VVFRPPRSAPCTNRGPASSMAFLLRRSTTPDGRLVSRRLVKQAESSKLEPAFNPLNSLEFSDHFLLARTSPGLPWFGQQRARSHDQSDDFKAPEACTVHGGYASHADTYLLRTVAGFAVMPSSRAISKRKFCRGHTGNRHRQGSGRASPSSPASCSKTATLRSAETPVD